MLMSHALDINGAVYNGKLEFDFAYAPSCLKPNLVVPDIAESFITALKDLAQLVNKETSSPLSGGCTPSDFPLISKRLLTQTQPTPSSIASSPNQLLTQEIVDKLAGNGRDLEDIFPLSPLQEGMLYHALIDQHSGEYVTQLQWTLKAPLNSKLFKQSWEMLASRYAIFRTTFAWDDMAIPIQIVSKHASLQWEEADLTSAPNLESQISAVAELHRQEGFNLAEKPGFRFFLGSSSRGVEFIFTHHHIYLDGTTSFSLLLFSLSLSLCLSNMFDFRLVHVTHVKRTLCSLQRQGQHCHCLC